MRVFFGPVGICLFLGSFLTASSLLCGAEHLELIVIARVGETPESVRDLPALAGAEVEVFGGENRFALIKFQTRALRERALRLLPTLGFTVQPNYPYRALENDPQMGQSWGLSNTGQTLSSGMVGTPGKDIGAPKAWTIHPGSMSTIVAILDTGIDLGHEDLKGQVLKNSKEISANGVDDDGNGYVDDVDGWNFVSDNNDVGDDNDHGTFVAGIIGAKSGNGKGSRGVAEVSLLAVKTLDKMGMGSTAGAVKAITYAVERGATIINASWGGTLYDPALYEAIQWAGKRGILFVAAAGNDGKDNDNDPYPTYPASFRLPGLISVAAYNAKDELALFSNYGKHTVDIGAPGVEIFSTIRGGYRTGDGTSFSAPFVAGVAALVRSKEPSISVTDLKERVLQSSEVIHYYEKERLVSAGRVHAYQALGNLRPPRPTPPSLWQTRNMNWQTPHPYTNNFYDSYRVVHPGATHVRVHFAKFATEQWHDKLTIKDSEGRAVAVYTGEHEPFWSADVLGDTLVIEFSSDYSMTAAGIEVDAFDVSVEK